MFQSELTRYLPTADELPCSDDTPVDNELQELIPGLLKSILMILWADRFDWFCGIDMAIYYDPEQPAIVPDAFISLGVERVYDEELRPCYVLWEEQSVPSFVLEVVSITPGKEYTSKLVREASPLGNLYAKMGVLYYAIYSLEKVLHLGKPQDRTFRNSKRKRKPKLEIYQLVNNRYQLQDSNPLWMPGIGLGIGYERGDYAGLTRDWLYWYDEDGKRYPTPAEQIKQGKIEVTQAQIAVDRERQRSNKLAEKLRALGIDPDGD